MLSIKKIVASALVASVAVIALAACDTGQSGAKATKNESKVQQDNYAKLVSQDPAHTMQVSPSRATINFWVDTWGKDKNKVSYVYLQTAEGKISSYLVFKGLPVSYCTALTPNYKIWQDDQGNLVTPAPGIDGVYYSGNGGCDRYYGRDALTGAYVEFTANQSIGMLLYDRPLPHESVKDAIPLTSTVLK